MKLRELHEADLNKMLRNIAFGTAIGGAGLVGGKHYLKNLDKEQPIIRKPEIQKPQKKYLKIDQPKQEKPIQQPNTPENNPIDYDYMMDYISAHEGFRTKAYDDGTGKLTIGVGHLIIPNSKKIFRDLFGDSVNYNRIISGKDKLTKGQVKQLFKYDFDKHLRRAKSMFRNFDEYPTYLQAALVDSVYRGDTGRKTTGLINRGKWSEAADEYINRRDYRDSIKNRMGGIFKRMNKNRAAMLKYAKERR